MQFPEQRATADACMRARACMKTSCCFAGTWSMHTMHEGESRSFAVAGHGVCSSAVQTNHESVSDSDGDVQCQWRHLQGVRAYCRGSLEDDDLVHWCNCTKHKEEVMRHMFALRDGDIAVDTLNLCFCPLSPICAEYGRQNKTRVSRYVAASRHQTGCATQEIRSTMIESQDIRPPYGQLVCKTLVLENMLKTW